MASQRIQLFISYTWDSEEHMEWVRLLAERFLYEDFDVILDQFDLEIGHDINFFIERSITESAYVLIIMTPKYKQKADNRIGGAGREYYIMNHYLMRDLNKKGGKYIPILRGVDRENSTPIMLYDRISVDLNEDPLDLFKFGRLVDHLRGKKRRPKANDPNALVFLGKPFNGQYRKIQETEESLTEEQLAILVDIVRGMHPQHDRFQDLPTIFRKWWTANPDVFKIAYKTVKTAEGVDTDQKEIIGFSCILPVSEQVFFDYKAGTLSEWQIGDRENDIITSDKNANQSFLLLQSIELLEKFWNVGNYGMSFTFSMLRHIGKLNQSPLKNRLKLFADGNKKGAGLLETHGFHKVVYENDSVDTRPRYLLDFGDQYLSRRPRLTVEQVNSYILSIYGEN
ncbi:toll/interleukin-1 receptor domain-containing protein [Mucilaginibacter paludis]|uniref:SEFIR domain protein n=1 Tax=Mucilaginibacter paludis DSM 18603 TaxID=714943 RepID=H1YAF3_9SPHI|nr:toll/interleukin-1 receptor domain-containing protein [Mucilaginibacter paludis]EHQ26996.1 SEFIR domain protein [Mucilaginibacter paludis DSM 18603]